MARRLPALVLLCVLLVAGCVTPGPVETATVEVLPRTLSAAQFGLLPGVSLFHDASADGVDLHLRLFLPDAPEDWKAPVILVHSPYFEPASREGYDALDPATWDAAARPGYWRYAWLVDHFVPRGYAVALADVRGTGESGGCLEQTGPLQTQDTVDIITMLGTADWSNGKVGMYGKSYDGETQQSAATRAPEHLVTIVPLSSVAGQYDYSYYDGAPYMLQTMFSNAGYILTSGLVPGSTLEAARTFPERAGCNGGHLRQGLDTSGTWTEYWEEREFRRDAAAVKASVLYVHGLQDWNVKPSNVRDWFERIESPKLALLGQWEHDYPEENRFEADWSRQDWQDLVWRWFDHWLLGLDSGITPMLGTVQVQDSLGRWRVESAFPPTPARVDTWSLAADATLVPGPDGQGGEGTFAEAPQALLHAFDRDFPPDEGITYLSSPLSAPIHWSGWPTMTLDVTIDKTDAHFAVWLLDVAPDGTSTWVNRAYLSAMHRDGVDKPTSVPAGEKVTYPLRFFPGDTVIEAGHRLGLQIRPADDWVQPSGTAYRALVHGAVLSLPIVTPTDEAFLDVPMGKPITAPVTP